MSKRKISTKILTAPFYLGFIEILSKFTGISQSAIDEHFNDNKSNWNDYKSKMKGKYIERQRDLEMLKYGTNRKGLSKIFMGGNELVAARNSCEVISVYNTLRFFDDDSEGSDLPELLKYFEKHGIVLKGYFGSTFYGIVKYFKNRDFECRYFTGRNIDRENMEYLENNFAAYIFMSYNNIDNIIDMIHTMSITKEDKGFVIHNSYNKMCYFDSLYDAVIHYNESNGYKSRPIAVLGINKH